MLIPSVGLKLNGRHSVLPGVSMAGVNLNSQIDEVISALACEYDVKQSDRIVTVDGGLLIIGYDPDGKINSVMCNCECNAKYGDKLWAGMSVKDVLMSSEQQIALGGCVVVDGVNGIGLPLPEGLDDFERITDFLPLDHVFAHLAIFRI